MRWLKYRRTLFQQISTVFVVATLLPLLLFGSVFYRIAEKALTDNAMAMLNVVTEQSRQHLESVLNGVDGIHLKMIDSEPLMDLLDKPPVNRGEESIFTLTLLSQLETYKSFDESNYISWYPVQPELYPDYRRFVLLPDFERRDWFRDKRLREGQPVWELEQMTKGQRSEWVLTQYKLLKHKLSLKPLGIIGVSIPEHRLHGHLLLPGDLRNQRILLVDAGGLVLSDTQADSPLRGGRIALPFDPGRAAGSGDRTDGRAYLVAEEAVGSTGWTMFSMVPKEDVLSILPFIRKTVFLLAIALALVAVWIAFYLFTRLTRPVTELVHWMSQVERGNLVLKDELPQDNGEISLLYRVFQRTVSQLKLQIEQIVEAERQKKMLEFQALNHQIRPHFLYNSLDSIKWKAINGQHREVAGMIESLSGVLRETLQPGGSVTLGQELQQVRYYVQIEQYRHKDMFQMLYDVDEETQRLIVPRLILQPLVENAIRHGALKAEAPGLILLRAYLRDDDLIVEVTDNGPGFAGPVDLEERPVPGRIGGIGLRNVYQRLRILYGDHASLSFEQEEERGTVVRIVLQGVRRPRASGIE